jgi:hypothetical protein
MLAQEKPSMRILAVVLGAISLFFVFYTVRLLVVTGWLQHTRAGGQGAFIGAVVFPLIALVCGWASIICWRRATRPATQTRAV